MQKIEAPRPRRLTLHRETLRNLVAGNVLIDGRVTSCIMPCCEDTQAQDTM